MDERIPGWLITLTASLSLFIMVFLIYFLVQEGIPTLREVSLKELLLNFDWYPTEEPPALGMAPLIVGSMTVTLLSAVMAVPFSFLIAIFLSEVAPSWFREILKPALELLGFLPSIVLGFLGMVVLAPWLQERFDLLSGLNLFNASLLMGAMIVPIVASLAEESLQAVPRELRDACYALGSTRWETIRKVVLPAALPGLLSASLLGIMRALGETMVVLMAAGGAALVPISIFDPVRPLTSAIAAEMGETPVGSAHYHALFFAGLLLLAMTLGINLVSMWIEKKGKERWMA
ncbi:phosphate ABC transporter permease subunit PstC [Dethiosulfovibrio sp. F2B]|uniref:phosphate ABC transporter permease subunit PstC n=1 Tax=Dethiosulfovibrio faecalis TaxID=2720018 RepID=UPI001F3965D9|nr:phosphate ABC transporter permease subunit PstC [Dethiosulfovibrio faecalis]MCF4151494.1 phosphate ABC transporter permease subunit PstC [Dethiosulfovibrio faecalis]